MSRFGNFFTRDRGTRAWRSPLLHGAAFSVLVTTMTLSGRGRRSARRGGGRRFRRSADTDDRRAHSARAAASRSSGSTLFPPSTVGYEQSEFFLSGTATAYKSNAPLTKDGKWHVTPQTTAPYTTRVVVYRPIDPAHFDGTVVVEWLNVTGGIDAPAAWLNAHDPDDPRGYGLRRRRRPVGRHLRPGRLHREPRRCRGDQADRPGSLRVAATTPATASPTASTSRPARRCMRTDPRLLGGLVPNAYDRTRASRSPPSVSSPTSTRSNRSRLASTTPTSSTAGAATGPISSSRHNGPSPPRRRHTSAPTSMCRSSCSRPSPTCSGWGIWPRDNPPTSAIREWETAGHRPRRHLRAPLQPN